MDTVTKEILEELYVNQRLFASEVAQKLHTSRQYIDVLLTKYRIPKHSRSDNARTRALIQVGKRFGGLTVQSVTDNPRATTANKLWDNF